MTKNLQQIKSLALKDIETAKDLHNLEQIRIKYLGRKGELTQILRNLKNLSIDERRKLGPLAQKLKRELEEKIKQKSAKSA